MLDVDFRGGFNAMIVLFVKHVHLQKDVALELAARIGVRRTNMERRSAEMRVVKTNRCMAGCEYFDKEYR